MINLILGYFIKLILDDFIKLILGKLTFYKWLKVNLYCDPTKYFFFKSVRYTLNPYYLGINLNQSLLYIIT